MAAAFKTLHRLSEELARGETNSRAIVEACFARIDETEPKLHAFLSLQREEALAAADASDARRRAGTPLSPLDGLPIAIKDNICTKGAPTTCASRILENFKPPYNATVVERLAAKGMIAVGKTNLDEFAMGSSTENSAFGRSCNPHDISRVPGGSSGGSAVAVASGQVPVALGSDTGGSIRQPAGLCGIVGLKPTYGRVSRYGLVAYASSLDQIGPFGLDVEDTALVLGAIAGHDEKDSTSAPVPVPDYVAALRTASLRGVRVARPKEFFVAGGLQPDVEASIAKATKALTDLGAEIVDVSMPNAEYAIATYYLVATAEASSNLARYDGCQYGHRAAGTKNNIEMFSKSRAEGFGAEVKRRIMLGTYALSSGYFDAFYLKAMKVRTLIKQDYENALAKADLIMAPTSPFVAFPAGAKTADPLQMYLCDIFTISLNLAGLCGISVPVAFSPESGLPIGMQLFGGAFQEERLLGAAHCLEQSLAVANSRIPAGVV